MNTDNMALSGETIDFGPCAFLDAYDPSTVFSSIDTFGRYAYANQPRVAQWNLARFAETLLPLLDPVPERAVELATEVVLAFSGQYAQCWLAGMREKLGLFSAEADDEALVQALLAAMHANEADFTLTFRRLADAAQDAQSDTAARSLFSNPVAYDDWAELWRARLAREPQSALLRAEAMRGANPAYIARNHRVEQAITAAVEHDDFSVFDELLTVLSHPYEEAPRFEAYARPPQPQERVLQTFCGT
jgi:uncharacterized protein YdiU (UPF0061 family)